MEKKSTVRVRKKRPPCIIFEPTEKARKKLDKVLEKGYSQKEVLCELLEKINTSHYKRNNFYINNQKQKNHGSEKKNKRNGSIFPHLQRQDH